MQIGVVGNVTQDLHTNHCLSQQKND